MSVAMQSAPKPPCILESGKNCSHFDTCAKEKKSCFAFAAYCVSGRRTTRVYDDLPTSEYYRLHEYGGSEADDPDGKTPTAASFGHAMRRAYSAKRSTQAADIEAEGLAARNSLPSVV